MEIMLKGPEYIIIATWAQQLPVRPFYFTAEMHYYLIQQF